MPRIVLAILVSAVTVLGFASMAPASALLPKAPSLQPPNVLLQVDSKCKRVDGKLVGDCKKSGKKHRDDDDDDDDDHQKGKGKGKGKQEDSGLTECTIQTPNSGGGCKNGTWKCEKMKSGKKCCGCVPNKNAPGGGGAQPTCESQCAAKCAPFAGAEDHGVCISECKFNKFVPACK